ncbi:MAG: sigma-E processing peptidase SpoIIGA [Oscillospiraceae bacterium]|jgi:stage II sporulation protein GA (sporulation sigma-E factor processing peptidase)|nr:sigma-E processing peptidase SpoIIGA [Oscillospiraceae bacterium]
MRVIYIDQLFVLNGVVNYLLLLATGKLCGFASKRLRVAAAAFAGAAYAVCTVLPGVPPPVSALPVRLAIGVLLSLIAFGEKRAFFKAVLVMFAVGAAFAGATLLVSNASFKTLLLTVAVAYAVLTLTLKFAATKQSAALRQTVKLEIALNGKTTRFPVLRDTGNALRDPFSGEIVPIVNYSELRDILKMRRENAADAVITLSKTNPELRTALLPYKTLSGGGLLLAFYADNVTADGKPLQTRLVAVSPSEINAYGGIL